MECVSFYSCRALARNCDAPIDDKKGASAKSWKNGKPVRVVSIDAVTNTHMYVLVHVY